MADKSFEWAKSKGLHRTNAVHGEEEAKLVLDDKFALNVQDGFEGSHEGSFMVDDS